LQHRLLLLGAALLLVAAAGACSKSSSPGTSASATPSPSAAVPIHLTLNHAPTGTVTLSWDVTSRVVTATVAMSGFTPGSSHAMHIHSGSCQNQLNPPVIPFPDVKADAAGAARESVVSNPVSGGIPTNAYLNIHLAPQAQLGSPTDVSFTPISCADIPAGTPARGPVTLTMTALPQTGQHPDGTATLSYNGSAHTLTVEVKTSGLPAGTSHAAHIHTGSCAAQGDVVHALTDLKADASGNADTTTVVQNVTAPPPPTGWYLNIHLGDSNQILSGTQPTLLFDPILCADVTG
jgi:hypothetical protein